MRASYQAVLLLSALVVSGCDSDRSELSEGPTVEEWMDAPNGREIMVSRIIKGKVIVFSSEYLPHDGLWSGHGEVPLIQAAWECSSGITITEHAGEYLQVIAPAPGTHFGRDTTVIEMANCVAEQANERFSVSLHDNALSMISLVEGTQVMPPTGPNMQHDNDGKN